MFFSKQLSSAGILPLTQLGINVANPQLSGKKVSQQHAVTSSLTQPQLQQQPQARQISPGENALLFIIEYDLAT